MVPDLSADQVNQLDMLLSQDCGYQL